MQPDTGAIFEGTLRTPASAAAPQVAVRLQAALSKIGPAIVLDEFTARLSESAEAAPPAAKLLQVCTHGVGRGSWFQSECDELCGFIANTLNTCQIVGFRETDRV